eukprot:CAMPEP_0185562960 /NCGR_PEP_ID=MMETSP1381-20130426/62487_1 /TAXON_ID=298111 /ORGANISM="Pavlova sp., Strain CCMP459" /LENGTH=101 /DNA_ID=CAMNT_0028176819 /DNA_START=343 /DNA_END=648 /DNA_ORIENTATION=+
MPTELHDGTQDAMVRGEGERGEGNALLVGALTGVVLPCAQHSRVATAPEEDEVLGVLIAHARQSEIRLLHCLVELGLEVGARVEGGVVGRVGVVTPAGSEP